MGFLISGYGLIYDKPLLVGMVIVNLSFDQIFWWIDIIGFLLTGKWVLKVAYYLSKPEISMIRKITGLDHLWQILTLMICIYVISIYTFSYSSKVFEL